MLRVDLDSLEQVRDHAHGAGPVACCVVDRHQDIKAAAALPSFQLRSEDPVFRRTTAIQQNDSFAVVAMMNKPVNHRADRCQTDAAGYHHDIPIFDALCGPARAEGSAKAYHPTGSRAFYGPRHRTDNADGVFEFGGLIRVGADGNGGLPHAGDVEHIELARRPSICTAGGVVLYSQADGIGVEILVFQMNDTRRHGHPGIQPADRRRGCLVLRRSHFGTSLPKGIPAS